MGRKIDNAFFVLLCGFGLTIAIVTPIILNSKTRTEQKNSLEYKLPGDFNEMISVSRDDYGQNDVTYKTLDGKIRFQLYDSDGTTHSLPITWIKPQNQK